MKRRAERRPQAPPLWLWPVAIGLVAVLFALTLDGYVSDAVTNREAVDHAHRARIAEFSAERPSHAGALHIIALGDSSLRNALFLDAEMSSFALAQGGPEIRFLRITRPGAQLHDFLGLFDDVLAAGPDLLVLQTWLVPDRISKNQQRRHLSYQAGEVPDFGLSRERHRKRVLRGREVMRHQTWIVDRVIAKFADGFGYRSGLESRVLAQMREDACFPKRHAEMVAIRDRNYSPDADFAVDSIAAATIDRLIEQASAVGTRLVFFDIPVESGIAELPGIRRKVAIQKVLMSRSDRPNFDYWRFDRSIPDSGFCDGVHLRAAGRSRFAAWFVDQLRRVASESGSR